MDIAFAESVGVLFSVAHQQHRPPQAAPGSHLHGSPCPPWL